jgi:hypothetical protein
MHRKWATLLTLLPAMLLFACGCDMKPVDTTNPPPTGGSIVVNEFLASNSSQGMDEHGEHDDWIELYNRSDHAIDLAGYAVTDNLGDHRKYVIPSGSPTITTIPARGFLLIWCDSQVDQGPLHTGFNLSAGGEDIGIYDPSGDAVAEMTYLAQSSDVSYGRTTDGGSTWALFTSPTPGASNGGGSQGSAPVISGVAINPTAPGAGVAVTVSATVTDDGAVDTVWVHYAVNAGAFTVVRMTLASGTWSGTIPGQPAGTAVAYYVRAVDNEHHASTSPATAPTATLSYQIPGGSTPQLYVNEFLASNATGLTDPVGNFDDWIEIYNAGSTPVDLGGMYMTDDLAVTNKWQIPTTDAATSTVPAHGYLVIWADSEPAQGVLHVNFKLSASGEAIGLYTSAGAVIDAVTFGAQTADVSAARVPDGGANWLFRNTPTPGATNGAATSPRR